MAALAAAGIGAAGSVLGGITGGKGAAKAAKIQAQSEQAALAQQQSQFNVTQANEDPFIQGGQTGLSSLMNLLGVGSGGLQGQQSAITALQNSPLYTSQYQTGENTILQNAAATGGLRGGNIQASLAQFGSGLLSNVIQNQLGQYSGLASLGQNAAAGLGSLSQSNSNAQTSLLTQQGNANALGAASPYAAASSALSGVGSSFGKYFSNLRAR